MLALSADRAAVHGEASPAAATGLLVKDYRGKDANQVVWKFDSALESKIMEALKQAAIEEGQWREKRDQSGASASTSSGNASTPAANLITSTRRLRWSWPRLRHFYFVMTC